MGVLPATNFLHTQTASVSNGVINCCCSLLLLGILSYMTSSALTDTGFNVDAKWAVTKVPTWFQSMTTNWQYEWISQLVGGGFGLILAFVILYLAINTVRSRDFKGMGYFAIFEGICAGCGCCCGLLTIVSFVFGVMGYMALSDPTKLCADATQLTTVATPSATSTADCIALATRLQNPMAIALTLGVFNIICMCCCCMPISSASAKFATDTKNVFEAEAGYGGYGQPMY